MRFFSYGRKSVFSDKSDSIDNQFRMNRGKKYWCGWASRSAWFVRFETHTWCGKTEKIAVFRDVCDCYIECNVEQVERWVSER